MVLTAYSGWTGELIRALIDDDDCLDGLTSLVDDIVNGRLARTYEILFSGKMIAGSKPESTSVRPIAMASPSTSSQDTMCSL